MNMPQDSSIDQSNCPGGYYRNTAGMVMQIPAQPSSAPIASISADDMAKLGGYSRDELIALIKTVSGAFWGYALADDSERAEAARLKLYGMGMSATEVHKVVPALDKWFDRTVGRAKQQIELTGKDGEPLSVRLLAVQERLLKDLTPTQKLLDNGANITI